LRFGIIGLARNGEGENMAQNVIQLPEDIYKAILKQASKQQKTPDNLVTEWVASYLNNGVREEDDSLIAFEREVEAFESLKPQLMKEHAGEYVAIHNGEVVAAGEDKFQVSQKVREQLGMVIYYVELVSDDPPRTVRMPSFKVSRE
jgi:hypothetical protein